MQFTKGSIILVPTPVCLGILLAFKIIKIIYMLVLQNVTISDLVSQCISKSRSEQLGMFIAPYFLFLII